MNTAYLFFTLFYTDFERRHVLNKLASPALVKAPDVNNDFLEVNTVFS